MRSALVLILLSALLGGCGQKGPLFIPDDNTAPATTPASMSAAAQAAEVKTQAEADQS